MALSILIGLLHYLAFPYEVYGTRVFGTYANPNVTGYVCVFGIALGLYCWIKGENFANFAIFIFAIGIHASGSLSALVVLCAYLISKLIFHLFYKSNYKLNKKTLKILFATILIIVFGFFVSEKVFYKDSAKEFSEKLDQSNTASIYSSESSSLEKRLFLYSQMKYLFQDGWVPFNSYIQTDSSFINLIKNYPIGFLYFFVSSFFFSIYLKFFKKTKHLLALVMNPMAFFVFFSILPFAFMQYILEEIPSLIFFYYAYLLLVLGPHNTQGQKKL
jgi:hypothetical protein